MDYRKRRTKHTLIDGAVVEQVEHFKSLDVHITNKLSWAKLGFAKGRKLS